jgi:hypothetical protein
MKTESFVVVKKSEEKKKPVQLLQLDFVVKQTPFRRTTTSSGGSRSYLEGLGSVHAFRSSFYIVSNIPIYILVKIFTYS